MSHLLPLWMVGPLACGALLGALGVGLRAQAAPAPAPGWQFSGQVQQGFDSNVLVSPTHPESDATTQLLLSLGRKWTGPGWSFSAAYLPEAETFARHTSLGYVAQSYRQDWQYALGRHTRLSWTANAARYPERGGAPGMAAGGQTANLAMALGSVLSNASSTLTLSHQYSLRASWSAGVNGGVQAFSPDTSLLAQLPANTLAPARSQSRIGGGSLGWSYRLSQRRTLQISATDTEMWFTNPAQRLRYGNVQVSLQQQLGSGYSLQLGAGPSWSWRLQRGPGAALANLPGQSYAANASLTHQVGRSQYGLSWEHGVQAGTVPGGVTTDMLGLQYGLQWGQAWSGSLGLGRNAFTGQASAQAPPASQHQESLYASGQLSYRIVNDWTLQVHASFMTQAIPTSSPLLAQLRRLQCSLGIAYQSGGAR
ncbi:MAG TPA: hypothetical protein VMV31_02980 [Terriglobales bacterium]|nr:hypothetical protein [Terriglobales bacterium]